MYNIYYWRSTSKIFLINEDIISDWQVSVYYNMLEYEREGASQAVDIFLKMYA